MRKLLVVLSGALLFTSTTTFAQAKQTKYIRYSEAGKTSYGILDGQNVRELRGDIFQKAEPTGKTLRLSDVKLLAPCEPSKVIAIGLNYKSHLGQRPPGEVPVIFAKQPTSIIGPEGNIIYHEGVTNLHYEAELVVVIGKKARKISKADAPKYIFGVTAGNDVSERSWQQKEPQWFRAKGADTFGPLGPAIVRGLNYEDLLVQSRLNGQPRQSQSTKDLIFDVNFLVSYLSQVITLMPGDLIYTGTPGQTGAMKPGDVIEVEVQGVGILRNRIAPSGTDY
jgi:2-keto-4-pentenoate hydratase/2-oxohepta-3-ene-1,7-dioic acid hydratase in catechol pathway